MHGETCLLDSDTCLEKAIKIVRWGGVIVYPTDTVYGVGGDPFNINTVNRVTHLKGRRGSPYPILVSSIDNALRLLEASDAMVMLMERFWPGGLTIVGKARYGIPGNFFMDTIGMRMPGHRRLLKLIEEAGGYLIGTSANISGKPPAKSIDEAKDYFGDAVDLYIDGGRARENPSTVVEVRDKHIVIRRIGAIELDILREFCRETGCILDEEV